MNVGIVTTWFERGAAYVSRQFVSSLAKDHAVFVYARSGEAVAPGRAWQQTYVTRAAEAPRALPTIIDRHDFERWIRLHAIELVLFNEQHWWPPVRWCHDLGVITGAYVDYYTRETVAMFGAYDFLVCNTRRHLNVFDWHDQCIYVPWGTDVELFSCPRHRFQPPVTFFHSSGMSPERKGTDCVLRAFATLGGESRLVVHTQVPLTNAFPGLAGMLKELIRLECLQVIEDTVPAPGLYQLGDIYVYPSRLDGIGLSLVEALAMGLPAIVTDCAPMNEFVDSEVGALVPVLRSYTRDDGYYWPLTDVDETALAREMQRFVDKPDIVEPMSVAARARAEARYDWQKNAAELGPMLPRLAQRDMAAKSTAFSLIADFEDKRTSGMLQFWIANPWLFRLASEAKRCLAVA